jgi:hypothetical protein
MSATTLHTCSRPDHVERRATCHGESTQHRWAGPIERRIDLRQLRADRGYRFSRLTLPMRSLPLESARPSAQPRSLRSARPQPNAITRQIDERRAPRHQGRWVRRGQSDRPITALCQASSLAYLVATRSGCSMACSPEGTPFEANNCGLRANLGDYLLPAGIVTVVRSRLVGCESVIPEPPLSVLVLQFRVTSA